MSENRRLKPPAPKRVRAIFVDLDGTLIDCGQGKSGLSDYSRQVFAKLREKGTDLFVATGRSEALLPASVRSGGFRGFILTNGARVQIDHRDISRHMLPADLMDRITGQLEAEKIEYALQIPEGTWMSRERSHLLPYFKKYMFDETFLVEKPLAECLHQVMKLELFLYPEQCRRCFEILDPLEYLYMPETATVDAYSRTVSKGSGVEEILNCLGIERSESMCFGDGKNDWEMFQTVGWPVAMGNAGDEVKERAADVCGSVWEDGVARYIEKYLLAEKSGKTH